MSNYSGLNWLILLFDCFLIFEFLSFFRPPYTFLTGVGLPIFLGCVFLFCFFSSLTSPTSFYQLGNIIN